MTGIKTIEDLIKNSTLIGIDPDKDIKELLNKYGINNLQTKLQETYSNSNTTSENTNTTDEASSENTSAEENKAETAE